ncbi:DUF6397 family protein [Streptomyces pathocidini]|uniref:DUF6397 family protein n=1 Tax=Streptomyces pathocidini TaxID=1650571 RepID=A0ABW7UL49_9ACTN|nr:DUF6397 family protein [Streptomyces pathocidini]
MAVRERPDAGRDASRDAPETLPLSRAARELDLNPRELELAAQFEVVRTVAPPGGGRRRVPVAEVERLRSAKDHPDGLRERVRVVGTTEGAELMGITSERFTRLARVGLLTPATFYVNRYRAVVWLYPAGEVRKFAEEQPGLLKGVLPCNYRSMLDAGDDWRPRGWRGRRIGQLTRQTEDLWERAAVPAAVLPEQELATFVEDPYERAYLRRLRPSLVSARADTTTVWDVIARLVTADDPDEMLWIRLSLLFALDEARAERQAPMPGDTPLPEPVAPVPERVASIPEPAGSAGELRQAVEAGDTRPGEAVPDAPEDGSSPRSGLRGWLRRRRSGTADARPAGRSDDGRPSARQDSGRRESRSRRSGVKSGSSRL